MQFKHTILFAGIFLLIMQTGNAQFFQNVKYNGAFGEIDWTRPWSSYKATSADYPATTTTLSGKIEKNTLLQKKHVYLLQGTVYVTNNAILTIEPGTIIRGDIESCGTLVIAKGSKIMANGTETDPIVFTSNQNVGNRKAGDWGGIVLMGNALINMIGGAAIFNPDMEPKYAFYGGNQDDDNSGVIRYVRIEFPGHKFNKTKELNGLSLCGVGNKTLIENLQVSHSNDDSFEMYGGSVNLKNIVSYRCSDDDFDFTQGYSGNIQFALALRHPFVSDFSGSRCIELESYPDARNFDPTKRYTNVNFANLTLVSLNAENSKDAELTREAIFVDKDVNLSISYSIVSGFKNAILFKSGAKLREKFVSDQIRFFHSTINKCVKPFAIAEAQTVENFDWLTKKEDFLNKYTDIEHSVLFRDISGKKPYDLRIVESTLSGQNTY